MDLQQTDLTEADLLPYSGGEGTVFRVLPGFHIVECGIWR